MKKLLFILTIILTATSSFAQQVPLSENYFLDKYSLAPSYAGNYNTKYIFTGFRSDWTGIKGGPKTIRLTFNDIFPFMENAGWGGKFIYDKAGIFGQTYIMGSYSYKIQFLEEHQIFFGLSAGIYRNRINLLDFYNDPTYAIDPSLVNQDVKSRLKFMSDFSAVWTWKAAEAGFMFSNISFGDASYKEVELKYNPLVNFQFHASYLYKISEQWDITPLVILRGGKYVRSQFEFAAQAMYLKKVWGSLVFRDPGILGFGIGTDAVRGLKIAYNFNLATNVVLGAFNSHEISIGVNIFEYITNP